MSGEIHPAGPTGLVCTVRILNYSGQYWNGTTFEDFNASNLATYAVTVTEDGSTGVYVADMPTDIEVGDYDIYLYDASASQVGSQYLRWRGTGAGGAVEQVGDITYLDIKTQVQYNLGRGADTDILAQMGMWARMALRDIIQWRDGWFLSAEATIAVVDGTQTYDLPTDHKGNLKIFIQKTSSWVELRGPIDLVEARRLFTPDSAGEPEAWSYYGASQIKVWPADPDASFTLKLDYMRNLTDLSADDDTNSITVLYPQLLIALMTMYGFKYLQEHGDAKQWEQDVYGDGNRKPGMLANIHANYVARTLGRDFTLKPRADVLGTSQDVRGISNYIILR